MRIALIAVAATLAVAAPASAAQRFASPTSNDSAGACASVATACTLTHAAKDAPTASEIIVLPGQYELTATLPLPGGVFIHGQAGAARPVIHTTSAVAGMTTTVPGSTHIKDLEIDGSTTNGLVSLNGEGALVENLVLHATGPHVYAFVEYGVSGTTTIRDTVATVAGTGAVAMWFGGQVSRARNVTAWATGADSHALESFAEHFQVGMSCFGQGVGNVDLKSSILHGEGTDLQLTKKGSCGPVPVLSVSWSAFNTKGESAATIDTSGGQNIPLDPAAVFVDAGADFHELPGAATIGAGAVDASTGTEDVDDFPRVREVIDMGAAEFFSPDLALTPFSAGPTFNAAVNPRGMQTTAVFEYGPTTAYGSVSAPIAVGSDSEIHTVSLAPPGLDPAATYHVRVKASQGNANYTRTATSADATYSPATQKAPSATPKPRAGTIALKSKKTKAKLKRGVVTIVTKGRAKCAAGRPACRLTVKVKSGGKAFASQAASVAGGKTKSIAVRLSESALEKLREAGELKLKFTARLTREGSTPVEKTFLAKVKAPG